MDAQNEQSLVVHAQMYIVQMSGVYRTTTNVPTPNNQVQVTGDEGAEGGGDATTSENPEGNANKHCRCSKL